MEKLQPFCRDITEYEKCEFRGGTKFRNGDTIMARITPCLENGKTAKVNFLDDGEIGFGSTEYIVFRAKKEIMDADFLYYLIISPLIRETAIKSMVGSSGRQRVQTDVVANIEVELPPLLEQRRRADILKSIDDKIALNQHINKNLEAQAQVIFTRMIESSTSPSCALSDIAEINPKRSLSKGTVSRCIDMSQLSTSSSFPNGWEYKPFNGGMRFSNGDTLLARITPCLENGKTAYINFLKNGEVAFGSTEYVVMCTKGKYPAEFFYCLARYPAFVDYAVKNMNGSSGRQRVSAETIGKYTLPRVTEAEISDFCATVPQMFDICCNNALENIRLANLRDALLPRLMSGEIDVSNIEI